MISDIIRKLNSYLSFWIWDNKPVNRSKDKLIKKYIQKPIVDQPLIEIIHEVISS